MKLFGNLKVRKLTGLMCIVAITASMCAALWTDTASAETAAELTRDAGITIEDRYIPRGSIVTEARTGRILFKENMHLKWTPASMSKLMVILLAYDKIDKGELSLNTEVTVTDRYVDITRNRFLSNNSMVAGCTYTVDDLITLIIVPSSAAATYMLADLVESDRNRFVDLMNERAASLGMTDTEYVNPVGVRNRLLLGLEPDGSEPDGDNHTSARDYAILAGELIGKHPDILKHSDKKTLTVKKGTYYEETFTGYNHALPGTRYPLEGMDGLKTGSADNGYNFTGTAKRGDTRLIEILMGVSTWDDAEAEYKRHISGNVLLEHVFSGYEYRRIFEKGHIIEKDRKKIILEEDLWDMVPKDFDSDDCVIDEEKGIIKTGFETEFLTGYDEPYAKISVENRIPVIYIVIEAAAVILAVIVIGTLFTGKRKRKKGKHSKKA